MPVLAIAHRGDPVAARENTLGAFAAAVAAGADMVELDLRCTADGCVVVLHDSTLSRLWDIEAAVADMGRAEVAEIGEGDLRIPTFAEVLETFDVALMVDFTGAEVVEGALEDARRARAVERSLFVSGNLTALSKLRALGPEVRIGLTWTSPEMPTAGLLADLSAEYWNPHFTLVTEETVTRAHSMGVAVSTWTVDERADMVRVLANGVDAIVSNRVGELRRVLRGRDPLLGSSA